MILKKLRIFYSIIICFFLSITCTDPEKPESVLTPEIFAGNDTTVYILDTIYLSGIVTNGATPTTVTWYESVNDSPFSVIGDSLAIETVAPSDTGTTVFILKVENSEGDSAKDTLYVTVINDTSFAAFAGADTSVGLLDTIKLHGSSTGIFAVIASWWQIDTADSFIAALPDTEFLAPSTPGILICVFKVQNTKGQVASDTVNVKITSAPTADAGPDTTVGINDPIHLHGTGTDTDGSIVKYEWKFGGSAWVVTSTGDTTITAPSIAQAYVCSLRVTDDDGLTGVDAVTIYVETNRPPQFSADTITLTGTPGTMVTLSLADTCSDPDGDTVTFVLLPGTPAGDTIIGTYWSFTPSASDTGAFHALIRAHDPAGASDTLTIALTVTTLDNTPPVMRLLSPAGDSATVSSSSYQIKVSCTDQSGVASVTCSMGADLFSVTALDTTYTAIVTGLAAGQWNTVMFIGTDASAQANACTLAVHIKYDSTITDNVPPVIRLISPAADTTVGVDSCRISAVCTDASGIASVTMTLGTGTPVTATRSQDSIFTATVKPLTAGQFSTVTVTAVDASTAANSATATVRVKYDNDGTPPILQRHTPASDSTAINASSATVRVIAYDSSGIAQVTCGLGSDSFTMTTSSDSLFSTTVTGLVRDQWNRITVIATDSSLAANRCTLYVHIKYDPTIEDVTGPSIIQISGPISGSVITDPIVVIIDSIFDPSDIDSVYWTLNDTWVDTMTLVNISTPNYTLRDTLTTFHSNRIVIHAIDGSTQHNRDSAVVVLDYNLPPVTNDTAVSTDRNVAKTWTLNVQSGDSDALTWFRLTSPSNGTVSGTLPDITYTPATNWAGADSFDVRVTDQYWSDTANIKITVVDVPVAPSIVEQPQSLTRNVGQSASFSVTINSDVNPAPTYQWRKNGTAISGATNASYSIENVVIADSGSYTVFISNSAGSITSDPAILTVDYAPIITTQPTAQTVCVGTSVTFSVAASGTRPLSYNWYKNSGTTSLGTDSIYTIDPVAATDSGYYTVIVSNALGADTSDSVMLTVETPVTITTSPASQSKWVTDTVSFSVSATGTGPLTYQWYHGTSIINNATSATYTNESVTLSDSGSYSCIVTNNCGSKTSSEATLTVSSCIGVAAGVYHSLFLKNDGTLWACGVSGDSTPKQIMSNVKTMAGDYGESVVITNDGNVWYFPNISATAVQYTGITDATSVAAGYYHFHILQSDGTLWSVGANSAGQLGDSSTTTSTVPVKVYNGNSVASITANFYSGYMLKTDGNIWAWGDNWYGQLGNGSNDNDSVPVQVLYTSFVQSISAGGLSAFLIQNDGTLYGWGDNFSGQLGDDTTGLQYNTPRSIMSGIKAVSSGGIPPSPLSYPFSLFIKSNNDLYACGNNKYGQLGDSSTNDQSSPEFIMSNVSKVSAGGTHSLIIKSNGTVWACGNNSDGQLGNGGTTMQTSPVKIKF